MSNRMNRDSNAEILRIVAMLMIVTHHFCVHALYPEVLSMQTKEAAWDSQLLQFMQGFIYVGVNLFVLISGYYGIKTKWRSFFNLYLIYAVYQIPRSVRLFLGILSRGEDYVLQNVIFDSVIRVLLPFSHGNLWFMDCYLILFCLAPLLNAAIGAISRKQHLYILLLLTFTNIYYGNFWGRLNGNGYTVANFVYLYMIGSYLKNYLSEEKMEKWRWRNLAMYVCLGLLYGSFAMLEAYGHRVPHWQTWAYNNPVLMLMAVCCFLFVMSFHFRSKTVNWIAASTLGVYIIQEMVIKYNYFMPLAHKYSPAVNLCVLIGLSVGFFVLAVLIDKVRYVCCKPIWKLTHSLICKYQNK